MTNSNTLNSHESTMSGPIANRGTSSIEEAIESLKQGKFVVVMDNEDRENEGDLIMPAEMATEEALAFMIRYSSGVICAPATESHLDKLNLPLMVAKNTEVHQCKFTISVDAKENTSTGISAADRATTIRKLASLDAKPDDFNRPGHIFPLAAKNNGVVQRAGHTEAAVDLARLAGCTPVGYICEINDDRGRMMRRPELEQFAADHDLHLITISDLMRYRFQNETMVGRIQNDGQDSRQVDTPFGQFQLFWYGNFAEKAKYEVLVHGNIAKAEGKKIAVHFMENNIEGRIRTQWAEKQIASIGCGVLIHAPDSSEMFQLSGELMAKQSIFGIGMQIVKDLGVESVTILDQTEPEFDLNGFGMEIVPFTPLQLEE